MFTTLLNIIFPKRCIGCKKFGDLLCPVCFAKIEFSTLHLCPLCNKRSIDGATHPGCRTRYTLDGLSSGVVYRGIVKRLVYQFKYQPYLSSLSEVIGKLLYEAIIQDEVAYNKLLATPLLVPVPLHSRRFKKRGYNHAELLARSLSLELDLPIYKDMLIRVKETKPQFSLNREERYKNIKGAFVINKKYGEKIKGKNIVLVDDVATSCATLNECANVLKRNGAQSVWAITFARE